MGTNCHANWLALRPRCCPRIAGAAATNKNSPPKLNAMAAAALKAARHEHTAVAAYQAGHLQWLAMYGRQRLGQTAVAKHQQQQGVPAQENEHGAPRESGDDPAAQHRRERR